MISATDIFIRAADARCTLRVVPCWSERFQEEFGAIKDEFGTIETHETIDAARMRVRSVCGWRCHETQEGGAA